MRANIKRPINRRAFLRASLGLGGAGAWVCRESVGAGRLPKPNPFAYDLKRLERTDPRLIQYDELRRFAVPRREARRLAVGPGDRLYLAAGHYVSILASDGFVQQELAMPGPARCLAVALDGTVYAGLRDRIVVFDVKGRQRAIWEAGRGRPWFTGIALGKDEVYVADAGNRIVARYSLEGKVAGRFGQKSSTAPGFIVPSPFFDLKLHPDGLLRVTNPGRHRVEVYTTEGEFQLAWGKASGGIDGFCGCCNPVSLLVLSDGRFVTCEKGLFRVKIHEADGTFQGVVAGAESFAAHRGLGGANDRNDNALAGLDAAVDSKGLIFILDQAQSQIRVMAPKGRPASAKES